MENRRLFYLRIDYAFFFCVTFPAGVDQLLIFTFRLAFHVAVTKTFLEGGPEIFE